MEKRYEEYAYVLDFLAHGRPGFRPMGRTSYRAGALIQCIGENFFTLLEALVKENLVLTPSDRVYVGKASRSEVTYIIGRISFEELTASAKALRPSSNSLIWLADVVTRLWIFSITSSGAKPDEFPQTSSLVTSCFNCPSISAWLSE